jgi:hypothetical protein
MSDARSDDPIGHGAYGEGAVNEATAPPTDPVGEAKDRDLRDPTDRELELEELRNGGPTRTPGMRTTTGGTAGPASVAPALREHQQPRDGGVVAPTTTGDATSGGMSTPVRSSTSDATTGGAGAGGFTEDR